MATACGGRQRAFGASHVVEHLRRAIADGARDVPDVHTLAIGDLSAEHGGKISAITTRTRSGSTSTSASTSTRVPDGYPETVRRPRTRNLDLEATWALLDAFARTRERRRRRLRSIFLDYAVQTRLYDCAHAARHARRGSRRATAVPARQGHAGRPGPALAEPRRPPARALQARPLSSAGGMTLAVGNARLASISVGRAARTAFAIMTTAKSPARGGRAASAPCMLPAPMRTSPRPSAISHTLDRDRGEHQADDADALALRLGLQRDRRPLAGELRRSRSRPSATAAIATSGSRRREHAQVVACRAAVAAVVAVLYEHAVDERQLAERRRRSTTSSPPPTAPAEHAAGSRSWRAPSARSRGRPSRTRRRWRMRRHHHEAEAS